MTNPLVQTSPNSAVAVTVEETHCTACGSHDLVDFFETEGLPVHVGIFFNSRQEALQAPTGDVTLSYCRGCGFVQNRRFDASKIAYQPGYEVALHHSPVFRKFMEGVADRLIQRYEIRNKSVMEIGCGCGYFLRMLCQLGGNRGLGYDPTVVREGIEQVGQGSVRFIRDYFSDRVGDVEADFICCLSVFEHIPNPARFLTMLRRMIADRGPEIYFEVFNAFEAFKNRETWSIHYEQCNYFSRDSLAGLFERTGFDVLDANTCYEGGQYVYVDARPSSTPGGANHSLATADGELPKEVASFSEHHRQRTAYWKNQLRLFEQRGQRVVVWGSGGKGISFLNTLDTKNVIQYVLEINPDKHGKFVPGSGQEIVPPRFLAEYRPDTVIITNALYEREMKQQAAELGVNCQFLVA